MLCPAGISLQDCLKSSCGRGSVQQPCVVTAAPPISKELKCREVGAVTDSYLAVEGANSS